MSERFEKGQKVLVNLIDDHNSLSMRDYALDKYVGQTGRVDNYYWMTMGSGNTVYLYVVRMDGDRKVIVLYEDEMKPVPVSEHHSRLAT